MKIFQRLAEQSVSYEKVRGIIKKFLVQVFEVSNIYYVILSFIHIF